MVKTIYNCTLPDCQCGDIENCQIWLKKGESNCSSMDMQKQEYVSSIMVNQCFLDKYRNICNNDSLIRLTYDEYSNCDGNYINLTIVEEYQACFDYCDEDGHIQTTFEYTVDTDDIYADDPEPKNETNLRLGWLLPLIAGLILIIMVIYCWMLKSKGKYDEVSTNTV